MNTPHRVDLAGSARLLPRMLGYEPTSHVVICGLRPADNKIEVTACYDVGGIDADQAAEAARQTMARLRQHVGSVIVLTYGLGELTAARHLRAVRQACAAVGVVVRETARVLDGRVWVGRERGEGQRIPAPEQSPGLTSAWLEMAPTSGTREDLAASWTPTGVLDPDDSVELGEGALLWRRLLAGEQLSTAEQRQALGVITHGTLGMDGIVTSFGVFEPVESTADQAIRAIAVVVADALRDAPLSVPLEHLRRFVVACQREHATRPLVAAAILAWANGNGVVAEITSSQALEIAPTYPLARLIHEATTCGFKPPAGHR